MTYKTHLASNAVSLLALANLTDFNPISVNTLFAIGGSIVGTLAPDIDNPYSKINYILRGNKLYIENVPTYDHRGSPPHWPLFAFAILFPLYFGSTMINEIFVIGATIGVATHLFVDMFNPRGVLLFAPFSRIRFRLAKIPTDSRAENSFFGLCVVVCIFLFFRLFA